MANIMIRTKLDPGVAPTLSNPAATWGVCQADEVAIFVGDTPTARVKGITVRNSLRQLARNLAKRPGAAPAAGNVKRNIKTPGDLKDTITVEANAAGVAPAGVAIVVGATAFASISQSRRFLSAVEECLEYYARTVSRIS